MVRLRETSRFCVLAREEEEEIPRVCLRWISSEDCTKKLRAHGFVMVTSLGIELEMRLEELKQTMTRFFETLPLEKKREITGGVYVSERGVPMYRVGYESQDRIRECFRVEVRKPLFPVGAETEWRKVLRPLRRIADRVLSTALGSPPNTRDDFSIAYSFYYPNSENYGLLDAPDTLVKEHADPSLVV